MSLRDEIREQPAVARRLLEDGRRAIEAIGRAIADDGVDGILIAARGTSDHAAIYAQYVFGVRHGLPVALAAPSLTSLYGVQLRLARWLVIGISQSGASPDVVGVIGAAAAQGAPTLAITNAPDSPLARAAEHVIDLQAGPELAVAATKTYTAELLVIGMLSAAMGDGAGFGELEAVPDGLSAALETEADAERIARARADRVGAIVLGRGYEYATAREWALKRKELARVLADPYSSADFQHGPLALLEPGLPVLAVAPSGPPLEGMADLLRTLRDEHDADLVVVSDREELTAIGVDAVRLPAGLPDWLMPLISIVPGQFEALHLARARGVDPDAPRHISKVTLTR